MTKSCQCNPCTCAPSCKCTAPKAACKCGPNCSCGVNCGCGR